MTDLPTISTEAVYARLYATLSAKDTETQRQLAHLELLAEALRDERDTLQGERDTLQGEVETLRMRLAAQPQPYEHPDVVEGEVVSPATP